MRNIQKTNQVAVVYLSYTPYGIDPLQGFIQSYKQHRAGAEHALIIVFKGMESDNDIIPFTSMLDDEQVEYRLLLYKGEGFDINAYCWAAEQLDEPYLFFLNSNAVIKHANWLLAFTQHTSINAGIIGATASLQSHYSNVFQVHPAKYESSKGWQYNFRKYKLFIKAFLYWRLLFKKFPNPHIRTNAFYIKRLTLLSLHRPMIKNKMDAYKFESGRNGLTAQLQKKGLQIFVVDKDGNLYDEKEWYLSKTFWISQQQNLLVSDNQTRIYDAATPEQKKEMTFKAWGIHE